MGKSTRVDFQIVARCFIYENDIVFFVYDYQGERQRVGDETSVYVIDVDLVRAFNFVNDAGKLIHLLDEVGNHIFTDSGFFELRCGHVTALWGNKLYSIPEVVDWFDTVTLDKSAREKRAD